MNDYKLAINTDEMEVILGFLRNDQENVRKKNIRFSNIIMHFKYDNRTPHNMLFNACGKIILDNRYTIEIY